MPSPIRWLPLLALAVLVSAAQASAQARFAFDSTPGSLPKDVVPAHYDLALELDPSRDRFDGVVEIAVRVRKPVDAIVLNAHELTAVDASIRSAGSPRALTVTGDGPRQQWRLADGKPIEPGEHVLRIAYTGAIATYGEGLFRVAYTAQGKPARMLATQLEPIAARRVFPGFDEPAFRATFDLAVSAPSLYEAVSNMPVRTRETAGDRTSWRFARTPSMPTYLVAVALGEFDALEDEVNGIRLRILTAKGKRAEAAYAMSVTRQVLPYLRTYFGVPYALPKLDQLAVPGVRWGAMEDWGLVSYNESLLLYDPAKSSVETKQRIYSVMAHELAHQWFGNLVTAASWDEIWLNEAFATWMAAKTSARFNPDWQVPLVSLLDRGQVLRRDAGPATRAIRSGPVHETAVYSVFDDVTYTKGGAVLEMLENFAGRDAFRAGLTQYFEGQRLSNATAGDLWHYLGKASGKDIAAVARSWTDQPGYPLVQARAACSQGHRVLGLEQQRFSLDGTADAASLWQVPLALAVGAKAPQRMLLDGRLAASVLGPCERTPWIVDTGAGFFRVQYAPEQQRALAAGFAALTPAQRLTLLSDTFALAQAGRVTLADYLALLERLRYRADGATLVLYQQALTSLRWLDDALAGTAAQVELRAFAQGRLAPVLERLRWTESARDSAVVLALRNDLIDALGRFGDAGTRQRSTALFEAESRGTATIPPSIRPAVIANVARAADAATYAELARLLAAADRVEDRSLYARALAQVERPELAQQVLALSLARTLPDDIASSLPARLGEAPAHAEQAYAFTKEHFAALAQMRSEVGRAWLLPGAAEGFNDAARASALLADQRALAGPTHAGPADEIAGEINLKARVRARAAELRFPPPRQRP